MSILRFVIASSLLSAVALAADSSDKAQFCGAAIGKLFEHPQCDAIACAKNWPVGRPGTNLPRALCTGQKTLHDVMKLCCVNSADEMKQIIDEAIASSGAPAPASRSYAPRVPNVPRPKQQKLAFDDDVFSY